VRVYVCVCVCVCRVKSDIYHPDHAWRRNSDEGRDNMERIPRIRHCEFRFANVCVFITAVPSTNLFAGGEGDSGGHVLHERRRGEALVD
jgi:hypothetical protein